MKHFNVFGRQKVSSFCSKCDLPRLSRNLRDSFMEKKVKEGSCKKKVMVVIDNSDHSFQALTFALDYVKELSSDSRLIIFASQPVATCSYTLALGATLVHHLILSSPELVSSLQERNKQIALSLLEKAKNICYDHGIKAETITEVGEPKEVICNAANKENISLLIIRNPGNGLLQRVFQGSLSDYCMNNVKCPVLLVKGPN